MKSLPDDVLAAAYDCLFVNYGTTWPTGAKAEKVVMVLNGSDRPALGMSAWIKFIDFLRSKIGESEMSEYKENAVPRINNETIEGRHDRELKELKARETERDNRIAKLERRVTQLENMIAVHMIIEDDGSK